MYWETGISYRVPFRVMFDSWADAVRDFNQYKNYSNIYHTIYAFRETEESYGLNGEIKRLKPNYETAIIDKVVLDLDSYKKARKNGKAYEYYVSDGLDDIRKMEEWAKKKDLVRQYRFSGGGFYFIFGAIGHPLKLRDFEISLNNTLDVHIDESTIGDTARMMRVTNSYNFKEHRRCYCIPLKQEELNLSYVEIKELAKKPRLKERYIYGNEIYDFSGYKTDQNKVKLKKLKVQLNENLDADEILEPYGWELDDLCDTMKGIINKGHVGNYLRYEFIKYCKSVIRLSLEDTMRLMVAVLRSEGKHSAIERQAPYIYARNMVFNPMKLKGLGYCNPDCDKCMKWRFLGNGIHI